MNEVVQHGKIIDARELERLCSWPVSSIGTIAWLMIQEQANGSELDMIAASLEVTNMELIQVIEGTTNKAGAEALESWKEAIITLKTSRRLNETSITPGWEAIESASVSRLQKYIMTQQNIDPEEMLKYANAANHAIRRSKGEGPGHATRGTGATVNVGANGEVDVSLRNGDLGFIRLRLSPAIASQIQNPDRIIDGNINRPGSTENKQMLTLDETRDTIDKQASDDLQMYRLNEKARKARVTQNALKDELNKAFNLGQ